MFRLGAGAHARGWKLGHYLGGSLAALAIAGSALLARAPVAAAAAYPAMSAPEYQFIAVLNADRVAHGVAPVAVNGVLAGLARERSQELLSSGIFSHYDASGHLVFAGMLNAISFPYAFAGENLTENNWGWSQSMGVANYDLMHSPEHRANILNPRFNEAGVGIAGPGPQGQYYYTQIFAQAW